MVHSCPPADWRVVGANWDPSSDVPDDGRSFFYHKWYVSIRLSKINYHLCTFASLMHKSCCTKSKEALEVSEMQVNVAITVYWSRVCVCWIRWCMGRNPPALLATLLHCLPHCFTACCTAALLHCLPHCFTACCTAALLHCLPHCFTVCCTAALLHCLPHCFTDCCTALLHCLLLCCTAALLHCLRGGSVEVLLVAQWIVLIWSISFTLCYTRYHENSTVK